MAPDSVHTASTAPTPISVSPPPVVVRRVRVLSTRWIASGGSTADSVSRMLRIALGSATRLKTPTATRRAEGIARKP